MIKSSFFSDENKAITFNQGGNSNTGGTYYINNANDNSQNTKNTIGDQYIKQTRNTNIDSDNNNNSNSK